MLMLILIYGVRVVIVLMVIFSAIAHSAAADPKTVPGSRYNIVTADGSESERKPGDPPEHDIAVDLDTGKRAPLETARNDANGEYTFSPDERWLYGSYHVGSGMGVGELFSHGQGPRFIALKKGENFSDLAWEFCGQQGGAPARVVSPEAEAHIIDLGVWSPDSARLLVSLRGGEKHGRGIYAWHLYWNTRTRAFELTDYLRALNKEAARRWSNDDLRDTFAPAACAEPLPGGWPTAAESRKLYADADRELNAAYAEAIGKAASATQKAKRAAQREWIKHRDEGAQFYVSFGADPAEREQRRLQYLLGATQQRTLELSSE